MPGARADRGACPHALLGDLPGTERAVTALAQSSLLAKARARPDLVRQVVRKARTEGLAATRQAVLGRLAQDVPLGYSAAGVVLETGCAVTGIRPGQLVATGGAGKASHAEFQAVPGLLCAPVPEGVSAQDAAFTTIASIALHALRIAEVGPGSKVVVVGLGLIGQLAARLAMAAGCDVAGIDPASLPARHRRRAGVLALDECGAETTEQVLAWSRGRGADAVLVCAAGPSPAAVMRVPELCRDRAAVVIVGDVGLQLSRTPFYERELSLRFARSYGPGRYDPSYEAWGVDYPAGQVRWSEGRNFEAVLDLLAGGRLAVGDLVTHTFDIGDAADAYRLIGAGWSRTWPSGSTTRAPQILSVPSRLRQAAGSRRPAWDRPGSAVGAGAFATGTLLPALRAAGFSRLAAVASAGGLTATRAAQRHGFEQAVAGAEAVLADPDVSVLVIATPHDTHAVARRPGTGDRPSRVVREAARADRGRARRGTRRVAGVRAGARRRLQPPLVTCRCRGAAALAGITAREAGGVPGRGRPGPRGPLVPRPRARAGGCSVRSATSSTPRRHLSARLSRT